MKNLKLYLAISYGLIWIAGGALYLTGTGLNTIPGVIVASSCMLFPLIATLVCQAVNKEPLFRNIGIRWRVNRWWFVGWLLMPVITLLAMGFTCWFAGDRFCIHSPTLVLMQQSLNDQLQMDIPLWVILAFTFGSGLFAGISINALFAFGEEAGWRGYLLRQFEGRNFSLAALAIGGIWGLWHAPLILLGHNYPQHPVAGVFMMIVLGILLTFVIQYVRIKSGSVIVAAIMHGTYNAVAGTALLFLTETNDLLDGCGGLAGFAALLVVGVVLFLFDRYVTRERIFTSPLRQ